MRVIGMSGDHADGHHLLGLAGLDAEA